MIPPGGTTGTSRRKNRSTSPVDDPRRSPGPRSSDGFTISLADGTSMNVVLSGRTRIVKTQAASTQDLTPGTRVTVVGARNQNGGITATMVTIGLARGAGAGGRTTTTAVP